MTREAICIECLAMTRYIIVDIWLAQQRNKCLVLLWHALSRQVLKQYKCFVLKKQRMTRSSLLIISAFRGTHSAHKIWGGGGGELDCGTDFPNSDIHLKKRKKVEYERKRLVGND